MSEHRFRFERLSPAHDRTTFTCGVAELDRYLAQQASQDRRRRFADTYILHDAESRLIVGYYTLSAASISRKHLPADRIRKFPHYSDIPAILIGRLAVDHRYRGQGMGRRILMDALHRAFHLSNTIAAAVVIVDAKDDDALAFYRHFGFESIVDNPYRLFIPMMSIAALVHSHDTPD